MGMGKRAAIVAAAIVMVTGCESLPFTDDDDDDETTVPATLRVTTLAPTTTRPARANQPAQLSPKARAQVARVRREVKCVDVRRLVRDHPRWTVARIQEALASGVFPRQDELTPAARRALREIVADCQRRAGGDD
jgi:hypothetical protein